MTALVRKAALLAACGVLMASAAMAGVPSPANSTVPGGIVLVGRSAAGPDTTDGVFQVTVRDLANNPINGSAVSADFAAAADVRVCSDMLNPNYVVTCATKTVRAFTNAAGVVRFTLIGGSSGIATSGAGTSKIFADGILLTSTSATPLVGFKSAVADLTGDNGLTGSDISKVLNDIGIGSYRQRADLDLNGTNGGSDIGRMLTLIGGARSTQSCASFCP